MGSSIEWTGRTLNAFVGCRRVSDGCTRCYAERLVHRGLSKQHRGLTVMSTKGPRWNGQVNYAPHRFDEMLRTEKRDMWFINSLSDLFFEPVPFETIAALLGMMAVANDWYGHVSQILTKRPERALEFYRWLKSQHEDPRVVYQDCMGWFVGGAPDELKVRSKYWERAVIGVLDIKDPFPHWLLVSCENQETADERIPLLLQCPAAVRGVSAEPLLGPIDLRYLQPVEYSTEVNALAGTHGVVRPHQGTCEKLDWVIAGSESGPRARPMELWWVESLRDQCELNEVAFFTKQIANEHDRKGGDPQYWPGGPEAWPREFPR